MPPGAPLGRCPECRSIRPLRPVDDDRVACAECVSWGAGASAIDRSYTHRVKSIEDSDAIAADGGTDR